MRSTLFMVFACLAIPLFTGAQKVLLLERTGTTRYHIYKVGNSISAISYTKNIHLSGALTQIDDSILYIENVALPLKDIQVVTREHRFLRKLKGYSLVAAVTYFGISLFNRTINKEYPVIDRSVPIASGSLIAVSAISALTEYRKYNLGYKWRLKVIDLSILKVKPEDFR